MYVHFREPFVCDFVFPFKVYTPGKYSATWSDDCCPHPGIIVYLLVALCSLHAERSQIISMFDSVLELFDILTANL